MKWLALATYAIEKLPLERLFVRPHSNTERLRELAEILGGAKPEPAEAHAPPPEPEMETGEPVRPQNLGNVRKARLESNPAVTSSVSTKETVDYQNREIGKVLLTMERHCVQRFRINDKPCDCGQSRHLLLLEALAEEAISMVENPDIYYRVLDWVGRLGPICTVENVESGIYDEAYPAFSTEARDLRKELLGTLDPKVLFPHREEQKIEAEI